MKFKDMQYRRVDFEQVEKGRRVLLYQKYCGKT